MASGHIEKKFKWLFFLLFLFIIIHLSQTGHAWKHYLNRLRKRLLNGCLWSGDRHGLVLPPVFSQIIFFNMPVLPLGGKKTDFTKNKLKIRVDSFAKMFLLLCNSHESSECCKPVYLKMWVYKWSRSCPWDNTVPSETMPEVQSADKKASCAEPF